MYFPILSKDNPRLFYRESDRGFIYKLSNLGVIFGLAGRDLMIFLSDVSCSNGADIIQRYDAVTVEVTI